MPQMPTIKTWLGLASDKLQTANIRTNRLDAEIILANILKVDRTYLHAHPEQIVDTKQYKLATRNLNKRLKNIPIAYITGQKEFYGHDFKVNKNTLIPRPESEDIIDILKEILKPSSNSHLTLANLIDVGTGSGCLGITAKLECPNLNVTLIDISAKALKVARENAKLLSSKVTIKKSNLLKSYKQTADIIIANLPYVDVSWQTSPETAYEPRGALFAADNGQLLIKQLIAHTNQSLVMNGYLIIESDPCQHQSLIAFAKQNNLELQKQTGYILAFKKSK
jgi:release factor glutamine methyltransferase